MAERVQIYAPNGDPILTVNSGQVRATLYSSTGTAVQVTTPGDAIAGSTPGFATTSLGHLYDPGGAAWNRERNNHELTLLASAARTTTQTSADLVSYNATTLQVVIDITAFTAGSLTITVDMKDTASGKYINMLTSAALAAAATTRLRIGPDVAAVANLSAVDYLPRVFRIVATVGSADSITYSIGYHLGV